MFKLKARLSKYFAVWCCFKYFCKASENNIALSSIKRNLATEDKN